MKSLLQGVMVLALASLFPLSACKPAPAGESDTQAYGRKKGNSFRLLLPAQAASDPQQVCFYDLRWDSVNGVHSGNKAGRVNTYSVELQDMVGTGNALVGIGAVGSLAGLILFEGLCLGGTVGLAAPGCFAVGAGVLTVVGGGAVVAGGNTVKWEEAFKGKEKAKLVSDGTIDSLIGTIKSKGTNWKKQDCPEWQQFDDKKRSELWKVVYKMTEP